MSEYAPGIYVKGDSTKQASTPADAVALVWDGYVRQTVDNADYRDLQQQAKELGIPANQGKAALQEAIDAKLAEPAPSALDSATPLEDEFDPDSTD